MSLDEAAPARGGSLRKAGGRRARGGNPARAAVLFPIRQQQRDDYKGKAPLLDVTPPTHEKKHCMVTAWSAPLEGRAKINVDAAYCAETREMTSGLVARDCRGLILYSGHKRNHICSSATEVEALACLHGVRMAADRVQMLARNAVCFKKFFPDDPASIVFQIAEWPGQMRRQCLKSAVTS